MTTAIVDRAPELQWYNAREIIDLIPARFAKDCAEFDGMMEYVWHTHDKYDLTCN